MTWRKISRHSIAATQSPSSVAATIVRCRNVSRHAVGVFSATGITRSPLSDKRLCRRFRLHDPFEHDRLALAGRDQMQAFNRQRFDTLGRLQTLDLEQELAPQRFLFVPLPL